MAMQQSFCCWHPSHSLLSNGTKCALSKFCQDHRDCVKSLLGVSCASVDWNPYSSISFALQCGCTIVWPDQNATQWKISYILTCSWAHDLIILFATDGLTQTIRYLRTEAAEVWQREWSEAHNGFDFCMLLGHLAMICPFQAQPWYDFKEAEIEKGKSWPPVSSAAAWTLFFSSHMLYLTSQRTKLRNF